MSKLEESPLQAEFVSDSEEDIDGAIKAARNIVGSDQTKSYQNLLSSHLNNTNENTLSKKVIADIVPTSTLNKQARLGSLISNTAHNNKSLSQSPTKFNLNNIQLPKTDKELTTGAPLKTDHPSMESPVNIRLIDFENCERKEEAEVEAEIEPGKGEPDPPS